MDTDRLTDENVYELQASFSEIRDSFHIVREGIIVRYVRLTSPAIPSPCVYKLLWKLVTLTKSIYRICITGKFIHAKYSLSVRTLRRIIRFSRCFVTALCLLRGNGNLFRRRLDNLPNQNSIWTPKNNTRSKSHAPTLKF